MPYFALATADGVCIGSVPAEASDEFGRYASHVSAVLRAKWTSKLVSRCDYSYENLAKHPMMD